MTSRVRHGCVAIGGAVLLSACLLLAACSNSGIATSAGSAVTAKGSAPYRLHVAGGTGNSAASSAGRTAVETARLAPANQSIIYTASLTLRTADAAAAAKRATALVAAAGGYTADEHVFGKSPGQSSGETVSLILKVPVPSYLAVLGQLSSPTLGKQLAMQQHATDVTQQVADVNSLVISEQDAIAALRGLLKRAGSVSDLLQVQQQISQDQSYLNSLLSQQRAINQETSYATITMTLLSPRAAALRQVASKHGFLTGLAAGWRAFRHATGWVLTALGAVLPFLILVLVLASIGYLLWRRLGGRRAAPTQPTDTAG